MKYMPINNLNKVFIYDDDDKELYECKGYNVSSVASIIFYALSLIFLGLPHIIFKFKPIWKIKIFYHRCEFDEADIILLNDEILGHMHSVKLKTMTIDLNSNIIKMIKPSVTSTLSDQETYVTPKSQERSHSTNVANIIYFDFHFSRYIWDSYQQKFVSLSGMDKKMQCYKLVEDYTHGLSQIERTQRSLVFGPNEIYIEIKSYFKLFIEEVLSPFYIFQVFSVILWLCDHYYYYASCIILITAISIIVSLRETKRQNTTIRDMVMKGSNVQIDIIMKSDQNNSLANNNESDHKLYSMTKTTIHNVDLVPGDLICLSNKGMIIPCDAVLVSGTCIVNESVLTGESLPIIKTAIGNQGCDFELYDSSVHKKHTLYAGTTILLAKPPASAGYATEGGDGNEDKLFSVHAIYAGYKGGALAVVVKTGFSTTKGQLVKSILHPNPMGFEFYKDSLRFVTVLAAVAGLGMCYSAYILYIRKATVSKIILRTLDVVTIVVPPSLPAAMTVGTVYSQNRLKKSEIFCISPPRINVCGNIDLACFDKTGTLTEEGLDFNGVVPANPQTKKFETLTNNLDQEQFSSLTPSTITSNFSTTQRIESSGDVDPTIDISNHNPSINKFLLYAMASCHSLTLIDGNVCGDPLELKMFQATKWLLEEPNPLLSPESSLLPTIVKPQPLLPPSSNPNLEAKTDDSLEDFSNSIEIGIIKHFAFSSVLQCMSVIVKILNSRNFDIFTKGSPEKILSICNPQSVPSDYLNELKKYTFKGFRVIAIAHKALDKKLTWHHALRTKREELEKDLDFLGFLIMKNALKQNTDLVIHELKSANIRPIMITGDNMLTAVSVAHECGMIAYGNTIIGVHVHEIHEIDAIENETKNSNVNTKYHLNFEVLEQQIPKPSSLKSPSSATSTRSSGPKNSLGLFTKLKNPLSGTAASLNILSATSPESLESNLEQSATSKNHYETFGNYSTSHKETEEESQDLLPKNCQNIYSERDTADDITPKKSSKFSIRLPTTTTQRYIALSRGARGSGPESEVDYHFAVNGKSYGLLHDHFPDFLQKLMIRGTIYARMSPDDKTSLVESYKKLGYVVSMCGDGANDCGALKAADAGISLSEAESSVASPFTSKTPNIGCVVKVIKEGRCSLVTSFGVFKFMALYSLIQFVSVLILYTEGFNLSDTQFLYIDLGIITTLAIFMGRTIPFETLFKKKPPSSLMTVPNLLSIFSQLAIQAAFQAGCLFYLKSIKSSWHQIINDDTKQHSPIVAHKGSENWDITVIFWISSFQYLFMAIVFSYGKPFRKPIHTNYLFLLTIIIVSFTNTLLVAYPNQKLDSFFNLAWSGKRHHLIFRGFILAFVFLNFVISVFVEELIVHFATKSNKFNNLFRHNVKPYEEIEKELKMNVRNKNGVNMNYNRIRKVNNYDWIYQYDRQTDSSN